MIDEYLKFIQAQAGPVGYGPPAKVFKLKSSGAEQDDEEPPTTARTKKFEKDEAKVGTVKEIDVVGAISQAATSPRVWSQLGVSTAGYGAMVALQRKKKRQICKQKYGNDQQSIEICMRGGKPQ
jgi:hypothetical protein